MVPRLTAGALLCVLAACSQQDAFPDVNLGYRNPTAPYGGTARFDARRFAGDWRSVSCLGPCPETVNYGVSLTGAVIETRGGESRSYLVDGPGILRAVEGDDVRVVMWVDEGFRTAVVGDAHGRGAMIMDRSTKPGADRIAAAVEILDFNGWDVSRLQKVK